MRPRVSWPRRTWRLAFASIPVFLFAALAPAHAQQASTPSYSRDVPPALATQARISEDSARSLAAAQVPHGVLRALELEREDGKLLYSMELMVRGKPGIEEVNIDAVSGALIGKEHESARDERREAAGESGQRRGLAPVPKSTGDTGSAHR